MSLALQADGLTYRYPDQYSPLFQNLSLSLYQADKVALLGANGAGKTTLLNLLSGEVALTEGRVVRHVKPYVLHQEDLLSGEGRVRDALLTSFPDLGALWKDLRRMERSGVPDPLRYAETLGTFSERGGYEVQQRLEAEATLLELPPDVLERPISFLSGGERRLLRLVAAFVRPQGLYLLDEPTNYLDERGVAYLETRLQETSAACLIVSHDRQFLDNTVTGVWELVRGQLETYSGTYSSFRHTKEVRHTEQVRKSQKLTRDIAQLKEQERTYKVWGARKEKEKSGAADKGFIGARAARLTKRGIQAKERLRDRAERLEQEKPWVEKRYSVAFETPEVPSGVCLSAQVPGLAEGSSLHLLLTWGERVALRGRNGSGKTTFLEALLTCAEDEVEDDANVQWDSRAIVGYLPQRWDDAHDALPVAERFSQAQRDESRTLLGALGVPGDRLGVPLGTLSEGQKRKVRLVQVMLRRPNVLVLDEPTTHLDYMSIEKLESALTNFPGTVLLVSHDRYLRERVAERVVELG